MRMLCAAVRCSLFRLFPARMANDKVYATVQVKPEYTQILKYINRIRKQRGEDTRFVCGYEAGCLGYSLYHQLTGHGVECVILAPSTMAETPGKRIKTDKRDAEKIARCLAYQLRKSASRMLRTAYRGFVLDPNFPS